MPFQKAGTVNVFSVLKAERALALRRGTVRPLPAGTNRYEVTFSKQFWSPHDTELPSEVAFETVPFWSWDCLHLYIGSAAYSCQFMRLCHSLRLLHLMSLETMIHVQPETVAETSALNFIYLQNQSEVYCGLEMCSSYLTRSVLMQRSPNQDTDAVPGESVVIALIAVNLPKFRGAGWGLVWGFFCFWKSSFLLGGLVNGSLN